MPHRLRKPPRIWAPEASLRGSYTRFIDFSTPFLLILVMERAQDRPFPLPAHWIFTDFCSRFVKGISGAPRGGIMSSEGVKFSKRLKLPTDLVHHTHEVWGPCSYKNTPLRRRGPRVLASYCGFSIFRLHFSTLGHFHMTILATKVKFGWETWLFLFIFVLKYAVPRLQAAARTLQLVSNTISNTISNYL